METFLQAAVMGVVQGLTEFLPVSSSAHLIAVPRLLGWDDPFLNSAEFDVMLHLGTLGALVLFFWRDLGRLLRAGLASLRERRIGDDADRRLAWLLLVSVVPAALLGAGFEGFFDRFFRDRLVLVGVLLLVGAALLFLAERLARHERGIAELRLSDALVIGGAQALALFPGISRSGVTLAAGMFRGLERPAAARFAFLMATPVTAGAGLYKARVLIGGAASFDPAVLAVGMIAALLAGLLAIGSLLAFLRHSSTDLFSLYRVVAAAVVIGYATLGDG